MSETDVSREEVKKLAQIIAVEMEAHAALGSTTAAKAESIQNLIQDAFTRAERAEAERDTAWNDAIEAAAECVGHITQSEDRDAILTLKKGDTP